MIADKKNVKRIPFIFLLTFFSLPAFSYRIQFAEQYYKLYHQNLYQAPEDTLENMFFLEQALQADFANPLYALSEIKNETEWEKYRYLFTMHMNIEMIKCYLTLGSGYDKRNAYFYNFPWKEANLDSLKIAEQMYNTAFYYWNIAKEWAAKTEDPQFNWLHLEDIQKWEDEAYRINSGNLDYEEIINRELKRLNRVRAEFEAMDENTY